ncbi:hypothetical protein D3C73_781650 [compost metagenome]
MAVIENGVVRTVGLDDVVQGLGDEHDFDAVAAHQPQRFLEEAQPAQKRELVHHHQKPVAFGAPGGVTPLVSGQRLRRRVEEQPDQRPKRRGVRRRHLHIERHRRLGAHEVAHGEVRRRQRPLHVLARQPFQIGARRALDRSPETVMHGRIALHRRLDEGMRLRLAARTWAMQGLQHDIRRPIEIGEKISDRKKGLVLILCRVEDMEDHRLKDL